MKAKVISILNEIRPEFNFADDVNYIEEGMLDSFDIVILVTALEERFGITIDGMDILPENFATSDSIVKLLNKSAVKK
jgi:acyl carrier protein